MPPISVSPLQQPGSSGQGERGGQLPANTATGPSFASALALASGQASTDDAHAGHGSTAGNSVALSSASGGSHASGHSLGVSPSGGGSHSGEMPAGGAKHGSEHSFQETALGLRAYRQQLIASNIANADTPGYKAVDIDFQEALRIAQSGGTPLPMATTSASHIMGQTPNASSYPLKYHVPSQESVDGNTVEMDVERAKFAENSIMYEFTLDRVSGHYKMMSELFQSLK
ncbi:flagellar basal body rod protein FlgB [Uliginosibacterium sp. 31-16]|uniref:flagellar basal body rod protein FlgB n=1 Tax=Uliginosibacterium sp. 31-16 TaxID=3068315 RepID=UPI00273D927A|nr:flagellar basal body rod protein FlgB [Uliginosibacterium sp. 31-16]MDP5239495.1 flagellar basal body rod protein FlgB [Uliginosibacterium sp. 31-16]